MWTWESMIMMCALLRFAVGSHVIRGLALHIHSDRIQDRSIVPKDDGGATLVVAIPGISDQESVIRSPWTFFRPDY